MDSFLQPIFLQWIGKIPLLNAKWSNKFHKKSFMEQTPEIAASIMCQNLSAFHILQIGFRKIKFLCIDPWSSAYSHLVKTHLWPTRTGQPMWNILVSYSCCKNIMQTLIFGRQRDLVNIIISLSPSLGQRGTYLTI